MKGRFNEEQIIGLLKQQEAGITVAQLCREHNVSQATFYKWKAQFGGMNVSEAKRLRQLEDENAKLKRIVADLSLDLVAVKDLLSKNWGRPRLRRWPCSFSKKSMVPHSGGRAA